ncbi:MAG: 16S rRNA (cytosine(1402)-N(4))-methyltransferase RsmH [Fidelibacterota bacterium]
MNETWSPDNPSHLPVLKEEVLEYLNIQPSGFYLDGTVGLGGHTSAIQSRLSKNGVVVGLDGDAGALERCRTSLPSRPTLHLFHDSYDNFPRHLRSLQIERVDGMLLDLGLSSHQLDSPVRGFSYRIDGPLDMRFDLSNPRTARRIVEESTGDELTRLILELGEERRARQIARALVRARKREPITTTFQLRDVVGSALDRRTRTKSLSRVFQAFRMAVNRERETLQRFLDTFMDYLKPGGRLVVISYHSLEDRPVKRKIRELARGCVCPPQLPICQCGHDPEVRILTPTPVTPGREEIQHNPRSRSAKLRAAEKTA